MVQGQRRSGTQTFLPALPLEPFTNAYSAAPPRPNKPEQNSLTNRATTRRGYPTYCVRQEQIHEILCLLVNLAELHTCADHPHLANSRKHPNTILTDMVRSVKPPYILIVATRKPQFVRCLLNLVGNPRWPRAPPFGDDVPGRQRSTHYRFGRRVHPGTDCHLTGQRARRQYPP